MVLPILKFQQRNRYFFLKVHPNQNAKQLPNLRPRVQRQQPHRHLSLLAASSASAVSSTEAELDRYKLYTSRHNNTILTHLQKIDDTLVYRPCFPTPRPVVSPLGRVPRGEEAAATAFANHRRRRPFSPIDRVVVVPPPLYYYAPNNHI